MTIGKVPWKPVRVGAVFTAVAFAVGGFLTGVYFRVAGEPTALGVSGSIVVLLLLAYFLSSVFLYGAQISHSYWIKIYDADESHLLFTEVEEADAPGPAANVALTAVATFFIGLFIGRRGRR